MLITRPLAQAMIAEVASPRGGMIRLSGGKVWLLDRLHNVFRPVVLKNRVLHVMEEMEE